MRCPECQQENPSEAKFCLECGRLSGGRAGRHEEVAATNVAGGREEPLATIQRRLHRVRMELRERLTDYFYFARLGPSLRE